VDSQLDGRWGECDDCRCFSLFFFKLLWISHITHCHGDPPYMDGTELFFWGRGGYNYKKIRLKFLNN